ncbi:MAG: signal recognition particle receptor subunit alpha, partial [Cryomorphaceae bacterium]
MFDNLSDRLEGAFKVLQGNHKITELNIADSVKQIRRALVEADVSFKIAKQFTNDVKAKALGSGVLTAVKPGQAMVKIVRDEMAEL